MKKAMKQPRNETVNIRVDGRNVRCVSTPSGTVTALDGSQLSRADIGRANVKAALQFASR